MRDKPAKDSMPAPASFINAQSAVTGLRGRDLLSTLRNVAVHGLRNPDDFGPDVGLLVGAHHAAFVRFSG